MDKPNKSTATKVLGLKAAFLVGATLMGFLFTSFFLHDDLLANQSKRPAGVPNKGTIQRQYALAMLKNDLIHWTRVSEYFPPSDGVSHVYALKSKLQIARFYIESKNYDEAAKTLLDHVVPSEHAEPVILTISLIELGYLGKKLPGEKFQPNFYEKAISEFAQLDQENQKLVRDSLPSVVREDWDRKALSLQDSSSPAN